MANKFFKQKVRNKKKTITQIIIISVCLIGIVSCFFIAHYFNNLLPSGAVVELRDSVAIEVNGSLPNKTTFFSKLENVKESDIVVEYPDINLQNIGEYQVFIKVHNKKYTSTLKIVDTLSPVLVLKELKIEKGATYTALDFVESCTDNSNKDCIIDFYNLAKTQEGVNIDYSSFTEDGIYPIEIIAKDEANNQSNPIKTTLTIGEGKPKEPECTYGDNSFDTEKYIIAVDISENNCALNGLVYNKENIPEVLIPILDSELAKIKNEFEKLNLNGTIEVTREIDPIPNLSNTGLVGFAVRIKLTLNNELVLDYHYKMDGSREYVINKYNLS